MPERQINPKKNTLVVLVGPTAIGKTEAAISLAQQLNTQIISADSRQFYKELFIGTAAPTKKELSLVQHYFVRHLSVEDYYNVSKFETDTLKLLEALFTKFNPVILTGGSGLYIDAVCSGIDELPDPDEKIRNYVNKQYLKNGIAHLQKWLQDLDPDYFEKVDKANPNRLMRGIEVCLMTGKTFSSLRKNKTGMRDFNILKIGLNRPRTELFDNISIRTEKMIECGLVDEVKSLGQFRHLNALNTVGYKEIFEYLDGNISLDQAITNIKTNTRRYAKRQLTWFKRYPEITWFSPDEPEKIVAFIQEKI
nr:tRNA (adenosine(37)-N6)-dimethylallyltransferase MiaA [Bacteroidota bacterium]